MSDRSTIIVAAILVCGSLAGSATLAGLVQKQRDELDLVVKMDGIAGMPPHVAIVTAALGTFRGLAVDILWARADHLQTEGEFYEAQTLAQWITTLQPRFQRVWGFQAWNLAWNITAATQIPAERWAWVSRGIELLRARGIPLNPQAANLYFDLAWIFQNKIGRIGDKDHWYYKARLAAEMQEVVGKMIAGRTTAEVIDRLRTIRDAPATLEQLRARAPGIERALRVLEASDVEPDEEFLRMLGRVMMRLSSLDAQVLGDVPFPTGTNLAVIEAMRSDPELSAAVFDHLVPHLQRRVLVDRYHMDPALMVEVMERYGPLDWRHPDAHGIYWSECGVSVARDLERRDDVNELLLVRGRLLMLMNLMRSGRVEFDPVTARVDLLPDPRFAHTFEDAIQEAFDLIASEKGVSAADFGTAEEADLFATYEKFLDLATVLAYLYGDGSEADRYFSTLRDLATRQGYGDEPAFSDTVESFVAIRFAGSANVNLNDLRQVLDAMVRRAMLEGLAKGDLTVFNRFLRIARTLYDRRFGAAQRGDAFLLDEATLIEFPEIVNNSFKNVMALPGLPVITRARIWAWAPEQLRLATYESLSQTLHAHSLAAGLDPVKAFPEPVRPAAEHVSEETTSTSRSLDGRRRDAQ